MADKILVIDDDLNVAELIKLILKPRGLLIYHAIDGQEGLKQAYAIQPDLIILDIMMPDHDGFEICARLREFSDIPILMLTAKSQSSDVTRGFAVGADDYVKKPFSNDELISRIESLLRRNKSNGSNANITGYSDDNLEIVVASQKVTLHDEEIALTPTEFKLLSYLIRHPHKTLSTRTLLTEVWGDAYNHDKALLSLYIHQLRQKLKEGESEHKYIQTQWGQGYWFNPVSQAKITAPVTLPEQEEQSIQDGTTANLKSFNWVWLFLIIPILLIMYQLVSNSSIFTKTAERGITLDVIVTADGFLSDEDAVVRGQVCISNLGDNPTENLSIASTIQALGKRQSTIKTTTLDLDDTPNIEPNTAHCYPYDMLFRPVDEENVEYYHNVVVTVTNYAGLEIGSDHCPGPTPCPFGKTSTTQFFLTNR